MEFGNNTDLLYFKIIQQIPLAASRLVVFCTILKYHMRYYCQNATTSHAITYKNTTSNQIQFQASSVIYHVELEAKRIYVKQIAKTNRRTLANWKTDL